MSATREYRNLGMLEDAIAAVGTTITVAENLLGELSYVLPDETPVGEIQSRLIDLREAHERAQEALGI